MTSKVLLVCGLLAIVSSPALADDPPRSLDDRLEITLFAEHPLLNTPTGIDVDARGRVWVIESNTHFPPAGYDGHPSDRLLILEDTDGDGRAEAKVFADGFTHSMSVAARPIWLDPVSFVADEDKTALAKHTQIYLATRREILLLEDTDGDDVCDKQTPLVHLETEGNYPHNGLAGFAFDAMGNMFFGFGENLGADYKIIGRDGVTYSGGGEGGNIYRVQPDGTKLQHWATGFWNPHANCVDAFGRLFSVDNDPDSLPPCRLLHIIEGGDYGYRFRNGRKGMHPFTAWNGEIPGTLPMVAGTGEAPSGILAYEHDAFPEEYLGNLIVTSWGDHRIDRFVLKGRGISFESVAEPFIVGGENFRPVGIALAPDGSLYVSDWVLRDYKLHKHGRVWRIRAKGHVSVSMESNTSDIATLMSGLSSRSLTRRRESAARLVSSNDGQTRLLELLKSMEGDPRTRLEALWALALQNEPIFSQLEKTQLSIPKIWLLSDKELDAGVSLLGTTTFPWNGEISSIESESSLFQFNVGRDPDSLQTVIAAILRNPRTRLDPGNASGPAMIGLMSGDPFFEHVVFLNRLRSGFYPKTPAELDKWVRNDLIAEQSIASQEILRGTQPLVGLKLSRSLTPKDVSMPLAGLDHPSASVQRLAVQWIAEEKLTDLRPQVEALFNSESLTPDLFLATLAALEMLDGKSPQDFDKTPPGKHVLPILRDNSKPANVRAIALRLVDPHDPELDPALIRELMKSDDPKLRQEAVRVAVMNPVGTDYCGLLVVVNDEKLDDNLRAEALVGIARRIEDSTHARGVVTAFAKGENAILAREALRALRKESNELPKEPDAPADLEAGRRLFYHPNGPKCFQCHTVQGRGGKIGPDLTTIGRAMSREKLMESIQKPSQEVAPQFTNWTMIGTDGKTYAGMIVHENEGTTVLGTPEGKLVTVKTADVEERLPQKTSVMPDKLEQRMTEREFQDLLAFLESLQ